VALSCVYLFLLLINGGSSQLLWRSLSQMGGSLSINGPLKLRPTHYFAPLISLLALSFLIYAPLHILFI
jgi:hypothetical protein